MNSGSTLALLVIRQHYGGREKGSELEVFV